MGRQKLLLIIDGIDELSDKGWDILKILPEPEELPKGVYILVTCRNEEQAMIPIINEFVKSYPFTQCVNFDRNNENHRFIVELLCDLLRVDETVAEQLSETFDNRLSVVPLLASLPDTLIDILMDVDKIVNKIELLVKAYLEKIELCYGKTHFKLFVRFLMCIAEECEGLTLNELSIMATMNDITLREICFLKDAAPFLQELRTYRGNVYFLIQPEYREIFRNLYAGLFAGVLIE